MDDKCKSCAECALFGKHKGHEIRTNSDVMQEITVRAECLLDLLSLIE